MRVVSLLPSATEILYALGVEPVGVSHECDYPPAAARKPAINRCRIDTTGSSGAIHDRVIAASGEGGVYAIDTRTLQEVDPDLIITQGVCEVCAVDQVLVEEAVAETGLDAEILTTDPHDLDDVLRDITRIGRAIGTEDRAAAVVERLETRIASVRDRARAIGSAPRTIVLDWLDPPMVAGHWIPGMIDRLGGTYGIAGAGDRSVPQDWADIIDFDPEVLIAAPCGFPLDQTLDNRDDLVDRPGWDSIAAVASGRAYALDGHHYVNRPGPRLIDTFEHLAALMYPEAFPEPDGDIVEPLAAPVSSER